MDEDENVIIVSGQPVDGFRFFGPFDSSDNAVAYATIFLTHNDWWLANLETPAE